MRGKPKYGEFSIIKCRITPAGAGKTAEGIDRKRIRWDHPRRCGENISMDCVQIAMTGSPPQVRGKLLIAPFEIFSIRITPAGAGKTYLLLLVVKRERDHPRRCGENDAVFVTSRPETGSPPQVRGKPSYTTECTANRGITPAGAGKTGWDGATHKHCKDHPRRCGENTKKIL